MSESYTMFWKRDLIKVLLTTDKNQGKIRLKNLLFLVLVACT